MVRSRVLAAEGASEIILWIPNPPKLMGVDKLVFRHPVKAQRLVAFHERNGVCHHAASKAGCGTQEI